MGSDRQKGRADASKDKYDPPKHNLIIPESDKDFERKERRVQEYREGYYDKKREIERRKK